MQPYGKQARLAALLVLISLLQFCLLSLPAGAVKDTESAESSTQVSSNGFMSQIFFGSDNTTHYVTDNSLTLPLSKDGHSISYKTAVTPTVYETPSNAIRLVLSNVSAVTYLNVKYTYVTDSGAHTETQHIDMEAYSTRCTYLLRTDFADHLVSVTLILPEATGGSLVLHAMETVRVYTENTAQYGTILSCLYDRTAKTINVKGSVYHDVMINAGGGTLGLFRLKPGQTVEELLTDPTATPLAQSALSIGFELQATAADVAARFARYVVLICKLDGTRLPLAAAQYADISGEDKVSVSSPDRSDFKGIDTTLIASAIDSNVGSAIVDVYLNRLENEQHSGYLYTVENSYFYFDRAYLAELDASIRSLSGAACKVYLRFLVEADGSQLPCAVSVSDETEDPPLYRALRADDAESLRYLYAYTSFLCSRYHGGDKGSIAGIIVGTRVDEAAVYNAAGKVSLSDYAVTYGQALTAVALAARDILPEMMMVIPVSDGWNTAAIGEIHRYGNYTSELFVESLAGYLTAHGAGEYTLMVESTHNPYGLSNDHFAAETVEVGEQSSAEEPQLIAATSDSHYLSSENIELLDSYLRRYAAQYGSLADCYLFHWTPDENTSGNALSASYVYHYYRLFGDERASAFFVSFRDKEEGGNLVEFSKIKYLVKYIDTSTGSYRTSFALEIFGVDSWEHLISGFDRTKVEQMDLMEGTFADPSSNVTMGSYALFDFSTANSTRGWYMGNHCSSLSVGYSELYGKTLDAVMDADLSTLAEYSDIAYRFEYPGILQYAPYVTLTLAVDCATDPAAVFEVKLVIGSDEGYMEAKQVVKNGELTTLTLNAAHFANVSTPDYIRLSVKTVMGEDESFTLHLKSLSLDSREYDSATVQELINAEIRADSGNVSVSEKNRKADYMLLMFVSIAAFLCTGAVIMMLGHYQKK